MFCGNQLPDIAQFCAKCGQKQPAPEPEGYEEKIEELKNKLKLLIENSIDDKLNIESVLKDNLYYFSFGQDGRTRLVFIDDVYNVEGLIIWM